MILAAWSHGLSGFACAAFAVYLLTRVRRNDGVRMGTLLAAVLLSSLWGWLGFAFAVTGQAAWETAALFADVLRLGGWYAFLLSLLAYPLEGRVTRSDSPFVWLAAAAAGMLLLGLFQLLAALAADHPGDLARLGLFHRLAAVVLALVLLEQLYRNLPADWLWNVKPLCLGLAGAFLFDLYLYTDGVLFGHLDGEAIVIRGAVPGLVVPLLAAAVQRDRGWMSRIRLSRKVVLHTAALLVAGVYLLFISAVGYYVRYFGGEWGRALQLALVFVALMAFGAVAISGAMRARLRVQIGKHFFRYRYDYREEWLRFTQALSAKNSPQELGQQVIRGLADLVDSPAGGLWLRNAESTAFVQSACWNMTPAKVHEDAHSPFCRFLGGSGWVINLEEARCFQHRYDGLQLPSWLAALPSAWLVVPLMGGQELIAFAVLACSRARQDVNWEVNDLLKAAGRQAASFLAQMQATEALLEARKFDAFNRMSAFVVHDLKNIVSQLSLMVRNAERHGANPEFQRDMLMTVEHAVERMRQLMLQLREGETPAGLPCGVDLAKVIDRIRSAKSRMRRPVEVHVAERLVTRGHEERIERVIGHLVQNAMDATEEGGRVWIRLERQSGQARIEVEDSGEGMSADFLRDRLFKPFQTTKAWGMGIGAYESFQYVQELGGKILVDSELKKGTRVSMLLPLLEVGERTDLRGQETAA